MRVKCSPLLILLTVSYVLIEGSFDPLFVLAFAFLHELGHFAVIHHYGARIEGFSGGGQGFSIAVNGLSYRQELFVALGGPAVSMALSIFFGGLAWASEREFLWFCCLSNGALGLFNLLPIFPLDGGRILSSFLGLHCSLQWQRRLSAGIGMLFLFPLLGLAFWQFLSSGYNPSLLLICIYLLWLIKESME